jgi:hypothetical protein
MSIPIWFVLGGLGLVAVAATKGGGPPPRRAAPAGGGSGGGGGLDPSNPFGSELGLSSSEFGNMTNTMGAQSSDAASLGLSDAEYNNIGATAPAAPAMSSAAADTSGWGGLGGAPSGSTDASGTGSEAASLGLTDDEFANISASSSNAPAASAAAPGPSADASGGGLGGLGDASGGTADASGAGTDLGAAGFDSSSDPTSFETGPGTDAPLMPTGDGANASVSGFRRGRVGARRGRVGDIIGGLDDGNDRQGYYQGAIDDLSNNCPPGWTDNLDGTCFDPTYTYSLSYKNAWAFVNDQADGTDVEEPNDGSPADFFDYGEVMPVAASDGSTVGAPIVRDRQNRPYMVGARGTMHPIRRHA